MNIIIAPGVPVVPAVKFETDRLMLKLLIPFASHSDFSSISAGKLSRSSEIIIPLFSPLSFAASVFPLIVIYDDKSISVAACGVNVGIVTPVIMNNRANTTANTLLVIRFLLI